MRKLKLTKETFQVAVLGHEPGFFLFQLIDVFSSLLQYCCLQNYGKECYKRIELSSILKIKCYFAELLAFTLR